MHKPTILSVDLENGKYTVQFNESTGELKALRYGEEWRNLSGDGMVLALLHKIEEQDTEIKNLDKKLLDARMSVLRGE